MMNQDYVQGFMQKAAELGVDPEALAKSGGSIHDMISAFKKPPSNRRTIGAISGAALGGTAGTLASGGSPLGAELGLLGGGALGGLLGGIGNKPTLKDRLRAVLNAARE
jgi:hypothetical protein